MTDPKKDFENFPVSQPKFLGLVKICPKCGKKAFPKARMKHLGARWECNTCGHVEAYGEAPEA